ncbi:MAG: bifunctional nicotinamide-nucleotide adenylyltransferase/Nudix hydroxylase [Leptospiraceae bacterium]|nr:bifunctional nicotinamide-nucleotide adenylyltransferase/Nudix hydroxylase [Leptospiraceae bacterium]
MKYNLAVFIGRFQPPHIGHIKTIEYALEKADRLLLILGDYKSARSIKNPFFVEERKSMILGAIDPSLHDKIIVESVRNYPYNDNLWVVNIQRKVQENSEGKICIVGNYKDSSSYYLNLFPQWDFITPPFVKGIHATDIREIFFSNIKFEENQDIQANLHSSTVEYLKDFQTSENFNNLEEEFKYIEKYKSLWKDAPFPPTFVTVDSVVIKSGHILIVKRRGNPGKGLYALPGGFLMHTETTKDGAVRELIEETGIKVHKMELKKLIKEEKVFDKPDRSVRGRTITHAFFIDLGSGELPKVKGSDDAEKAIWVPISDLYLNMENFFEDHFAIIEYFIYKV